MQWGTLKGLIRALVGDPERAGGSLMKFSAQQIADSANFALNYYVNRTECTRKTVTTTWLDGVLTMTGINGDNIKSIVIGTNSLDSTTFDFEEMKNPAFLFETGTAFRRWMWMAGNKVMLLPPLGVAPGTAHVTFVDSPTEVAAATLDNVEIDPRIPVDHHAYLKYLAGSYLNRIGKPGMEEIKEDALIKTFLDMSGV